MDNFHTSVLLQVSSDFLDVHPGAKYIDATIGGGGHASELLKRGGVILGIDMDQDALNFIRENYKLQISNNKLTVVQGNFRDIKNIAEKNKFQNVSGILFDLGVSSHQVNTPGRGFSFSKEASLDMRMDTKLPVTAADLVNGLTKGELYELFIKYGEETNSFAIVNNIIRSRGIKKIETTSELAQIIERSSGKNYSRGNDNKRRIHPATKIFQALRIAVNDELNNLKEALPQAIELLKTHGRLVIISFHSLEDRIVKRTFLQFEKQGVVKIVTRHPIEAGSEEITINNRSRSAKLRVCEKL